MIALHYCVDVLMERVPLANRWVSEQWRPAAVVPAFEGRGAPAPAERVADGPNGTTWRFGGHDIELHVSEAEGYYLNITSDTPLVFVMWRPAEDGVEPAAHPKCVTVSYNEAGRFMDGGEKVDPVPMPDVILAWMQAFVAEHYKPEPRRKVKRNDPFKDGAFVRERLPRE
jgi:hypothetical protein